jgi:multidrug resistance efflux pump
VVVATQYPAAVVDLPVREGWNVERGQVLARVRSQSVEESLAKLHAQLAGVMTRATELSIRDRVDTALYPLARHRYELAREARVSSEELLSRQLLTTNRRSELVKDEAASAESEAQLAAERDVLAREGAGIRAAIDSTQTAIKRLNELYGTGIIASPVSGIIGSLTASDGSVIREGEPIMEIFTGPPFVLAYVPEGALYDVKEGDRVHVGIGLASYDGHVGQSFDISGRLPKEFQQTFQPVTRARLIRVEFAPDQRQLPPLFAKTKLSAAGWPSDWLRRVIFGYLHLPIFEPGDRNAAN